MISRLFFFHIMVTGGNQSSRVDDLRYQFGSHNYRVYKLAEAETIDLLRDIFSQHRRLTSDLDLVNVGAALKAYWPQPDFELILSFIEDLGFERGKGTILPSYAELSQGDPSFQQHFVRYLRARQRLPEQYGERDAYQSYIGYQWSTPVHLGILSAASNHKSEKKQLLEQLRYWQEHSGYLTMIGPHFGLSRDYDEFVLGIAPPLWALIAVLMRDNPDSVEYISRQCRLVLAELERAPIETSFFTAVWLLHISASNGSADTHYQYGRSFINDRGGIPTQSLFEPTGRLVSQGEPGWSFDESSRFEEVPAALEFKANLKTKDLVDYSSCSKLALAMDALLDEATFRFWAPQLVSLLQADET